jgi:hypothetical protein
MNVENGIVIADIPCVSCGYNLRMQKADGVCPECSGWVATSLASPVAIGGTPYLRRMGWAAGISAWLNLAMIALIGTFILSLLLLAVFTHERAVEVVILGFFAMVWLLTSFHIWPVWLIAREPAKGKGGVREILLLVTSVVTSLLLFIPVVLISLEFIGRPMSGGHWLEIALKTLLGGVVIMIPAVATFFVLYGMQLSDACQSAGNGSLAWWHRWTWRVPALGAAGVNLAFFVAFLAITEVLRPAGEFLQWIVVGAAIAGYGGVLLIALSLIATTSLLFRTASRFRKQAREMELASAQLSDASDPRGSTNR